MGNLGSSGSNPIPTIFKFNIMIIEQLVIDAGCFLAINEFAIFSEDCNDCVPEVLQALSLCIRNGLNSIEMLAWFRFVIRQRTCVQILQQKFPVPNNLKNDKQRSAWVRAKRRVLLNNQWKAEDAFLENIKIIIKNGDYN